MALNLNEQDVEKFNTVLGTFNSSMLAASKSAEARKIAEAQLIKSIMRATGKNEEQARITAKLIRQEEELEKKREQREEAMANGIKLAINGLKDFFGGTVASTQALYNADNAFTGVIPTLNLIGNTIKTITAVFSTFLSGFPIVGAFFGAVDKAVGAVIDVGVQVMSAQLENAGKMVENFNSISKTGMTFGASLDKMQKTALSAGMSIGTFNKFVTNNLENLSDMGGALERNVAIVGKESYAIGRNNKALLAAYGGYDALAGATATYMAQLAGYGIDTSNLTIKQKDSIKEYLVQQKELTAITGLSAEAQKKNEDERRKQAIYQLKMADLERTNPERAQNVIRNIELFGKLSAEHAKYATEVFNTGGNIISRQGLLFEQQYPEMAQAIRKTTMDAQRMNNAEFRKEQSDYLTRMLPLIEQEAEARKDLYTLSAGDVKNEYIDQLVRTASGTISGISLFKNLAKTNAELEANRGKLLSKEKNAIGDVIDKLEDFKKNMDSGIIKSFDSLATITKRLIEFNTLLVDKMVGPASEFIVDKLANLLDDLLEQAGVSKPKVAVDRTPREIPNTQTAKLQRENAESEAVRLAKERDRLRDENKVGTQEFKDARIAAFKAQRAAEIARRTEESAIHKRTLETAPGHAISPSQSGGHLLPLKSGETTAGGPTEPALLKVLDAVYQKNKNIMITALNDLAHKDPKNPAYNPLSAHLWGGGADVVMTHGTRVDLEKLKQQVIEELTKQGVKGTAEIHKDAGGTGEHLHIQLDKSEKRSEVMHNEQVALLKEQNTILTQMLRMQT